MAYMLLPAAHLSNMQPEIKKSAVCRRAAGSANPPQGGESGVEETALLAADGGKESLEDLKREMDNVHADLEMVEAWLKSRSGCTVLPSILSLESDLHHSPGYGGARRWKALVPHCSAPTRSRQR